MSCELLAATHMHNTLHCTYTFLHSAHNKRVMIFLDTASTTHAPRASSRFSHALRASTALYCTRIRNRERKWLHLCSLLRWHYLSPSPRLRPCVAWQGSKEAGGHPEKYSSTQLRRLCPGDVRASGGSVLLVPMITLCTGDLEECVRGGLKPESSG